MFELVLLFDSYHGVDENARVLVPKFNELSPQEQQAILTGPGWVKNPAVLGLEDFSDISEFKCHTEDSPDHWGSNNFRLFFQYEGWVGEIYRQREAYQRFEIIYPERVEHLRDRMHELDSKPDDPLWEDLLRAYKLMRQLVDINDKDVVSHGRVEKLFLTI